jgi:hypothetical protein
MENIRQTDTETTRIQDMLDKYLASRSVLKSSAAETSAHLDEDALAAFAEGRLSRRENEPVVTHLVACGFCLHKTAELVRLDLDLADVAETTTLSESPEPSRISAVLSDILSKMFGTTDGAVFAHEEKSENDKADEDDKPGD